MKIKRKLKHILPKDTVNAIQRKKAYRRIRKAEKNEARRFTSHFASSTSSSLVQIESRLIFFVHQIEKGFSFDIYQYGRGRHALTQISALITQLMATDANWRHNLVYQEAILALGEYLRRHVQAGHDISFITDIFNEQINHEIESSSQHEYPSIEVSYDSKKDNAAANFSELTERRHAIRSYSDTPVTKQDLEPVIELALRTPSVCNRQPTRVRIFTDKDTITQALKVQGGFGGYDAPPALILVSSDLQAFMNINEHNEGYVDGGLFAMSLLYALEASGYAACPLNTMFSTETDEETRRLLAIPDNEVLIMYIAVGHFRDTSRICLSRRFNLNHVLLN